MTVDDNFAKIFLNLQIQPLVSSLESSLVKSKKCKRTVFLSAQIKNCPTEEERKNSKRIFFAWLANISIQCFSCSSELLKKSGPPFFPFFLIPRLVFRRLVGCIRV